MIKEDNDVNLWSPAVVRYSYTCVPVCEHAYCIHPLRHRESTQPEFIPLVSIVMGFECLGPSDYSACSQQVLEIDSLLLCILLILVPYLQPLFAVDSPNALNELGKYPKNSSVVPYRHPCVPRTSVLYSHRGTR